uniref:Dienelactone hydrolase domain-containing protein n=1 Tax=Plectus sambesii TaxID=2011161 RepID=A0A914WM25_9BILA
MAVEPATALAVVTSTTAAQLVRPISPIMFRFSTLVYLCLAVVASVQAQQQQARGNRLADVPIQSRLVQYNDGNVRLTGYLAYPLENGTARPGILIAHDFNGRDAFEDGKANDLARLGYVAFAYDLYGKVGATTEENMGLMRPFTENRDLLLKRIQLSLDQLKQAPGVNQNMLGAIGFCFGGMAVLDMARANLAGVQVVVSFHGTLDPPPTTNTSSIRAKVLVCHGHNDSSITPDKVPVTHPKYSTSRVFS